MEKRHQLVISDYLATARDVLDRAYHDAELHTTINAIAHAWTGALRNGGKILLCGNGGSAADAQHLAGELVSRFMFDRAPLPALALTVDTSILTGIGNDYGYEQIFARQVRALGRPGDVLAAFSTSGRSANILAALKAAKECALVTTGFTGQNNSPMSDLCDILVRAPSPTTPHIQQVHITVGHVLCQIVEENLFGTGKN